VGYFYCHHHWQRNGVGRAIYSALETHAVTSGIPELTAAVSKTAHPFFLSVGFEVVQAQSKIICGAPAPNFIMRKRLVPVE
jgi:putative acetyltransferase